MSLLGAAGISAAGSILGGIIGNKSAKQQQERSEAFQREVLQNQMQWRKSDAQKAGLHPLAVLGMSPATGASSVVGDSLGSGISDAASKIGEYVASKDLHKLQVQEIQSRINLNEANAAKAASQAARTASGSNFSQDPEALIIGGENVPRNPNYSDTQIIEDRYGDVGGAIYGLGVGVADAYHFLNTKYPGRSQSQNSRAGYRRGNRNRGNNLSNNYRGSTGGRNRRNY